MVYERLWILEEAQGRNIVWPGQPNLQTCLPLMRKLMRNTMEHLHYMPHSNICSLFTTAYEQTFSSSSPFFLPSTSHFTSSKLWQSRLAIRGSSQSLLAPSSLSMGSTLLNSRHHKLNALTLICKAKKPSKEQGGGEQKCKSQIFFLHSLLKRCEGGWYR